MARLVRKDEVDPNRFTDKEFTRRPAFPNHPNDYSMIIDGLIAGRIMQMMRPGGRVMWFWSLTAPYYPRSNPHNGEEETFEAASEAFMKLFWEWHAWALKQPGKVTWYGAKE